MASDNANEYPEAAKAVHANFYMDNYLDSVEPPKRALNISKHFVSLLPCVQPSLQFLWQDTTSNVVVHKYTRHIFGKIDSPTCANYAIQRMASDNAKEYPEAAKAVLENFYMDYYLDSVESPERALNMSKQFVNLLHLVWFQLTKFVSNVPDLADRIDGSAQSTDPKVIISSK